MAFLSTPGGLWSRAVLTVLVSVHALCALTQPEKHLPQRGYVDVCPVGQTTGCHKIGYNDSNTSTQAVVIPSSYKAGQDYTFSMVAPTITAPPTTSISGSTTFYTSFSQQTTSSGLIVVPIIVPLPIGEPIPPVIPSIPVETLELPEASDLPTSDSAPTTSDPGTSSVSSNSDTATTTSGSTSSVSSSSTTSSSTSSSSGGAFCTVPTPVSQSPPVNAISQSTTYSIDNGDSSSSASDSSSTVSTSPSAAPTTSSGPNCEHQGVSINGLDPGTLKDLVGKFCIDGMGSTNKTLGGSDLNPTVDLNGVSVQLSYIQFTGNCPANCADTFAGIISTCQYDSHTIIGTGELDQPCGDYSFSIIAPNPGSTTVPASTTPSTSSSTSAPSSTGPPGWPAITGAACFSGTPQGQKEFHGSRASAFISQECSVLDSSISASYPQATDFNSFGFDYPDGSNQADPNTDIVLYANGGSNNIPGGNDCVTGFTNALNNCPSDANGFWGGAVSYNNIEFSIYGQDASTASPTSSHKRDAWDPYLDIPQRSAPRETHLYAYAACPKVHGCDQGYAVADRYAFSPPSICDSGFNEISFYSIDSGPGLDMAFKAFGHEGCRVKTSMSDPESLAPGAQWGSLDCGGNLVGSCLAPRAGEEGAKLCVEETEKNKMGSGTVLKMMAVCRF